MTIFDVLIRRRRENYRVDCERERCAWCRRKYLCVQSHFTRIRHRRVKVAWMEVSRLSRTKGKLASSTGMITATSLSAQRQLSCTSDDIILWPKLTLNSSWHERCSLARNNKREFQANDPRTNFLLALFLAFLSDDISHKWFAFVRKLLSWFIRRELSCDYFHEMSNSRLNLRNPAKLWSHRFNLIWKLIKWASAKFKSAEWL